MSEEKNVTLEQDVLVEKEVVNAPAEPVTEPWKTMLKSWKLPLSA